MGLLENIERTMRANGSIDTICLNCKKKEYMVTIDEDTNTPSGRLIQKGSFSVVCGCGVSRYDFHNVSKFPDPNNPKSYFTKRFIPKNKYDADYDKKNVLEKAGLKKNGKGVFVKGFINIWGK